MKRSDILERLLNVSWYQAYEILPGIVPRDWQHDHPKVAAKRERMRREIEDLRRIGQ